ncbi:TPA: ImmA/IrrE family metallo-endopeptidase [Streptococcus agalactiae]|uniref:ImmA/IrrE family metallo-endopeptidase n=1 Tax=Streptococcus agalactiae TaxID=1311 RepID=UPI0005DCE2FF|nr:ImmA/IrrE family metallo-endopeptidase [Streptococcus agalactiae]HEP3841742.1 ImmA/IrrE family metallo-endopeptidase [Streptococcus pyogenes]CFQ77982.1 phage protein [Streptococcus agalactiae]CNK15234.1 phage protein [Streptococcus agalactiae]CQJ46201.1 phage protein [Streptococcus agalactiae]HEN0882676.1 ImmA/IrrE family metallo-endopeptidase [Streptococcus agalactiae]
MTEREIFEEFGVRIEIYEDSLFEDEAFYIPELLTMFISSAIPESKRVQVTLHELGHKGHLPHLYNLFREKCELEANRNMIHYLMKEEIERAEDCSVFNYLVFMEKYDLKTLVDETMVLEEYYSLVHAS